MFPWPHQRQAAWRSRTAGFHVPEGRGVNLRVLPDRGLGVAAPETLVADVSAVTDSTVPPDKF